jgi:2-polyprenyl-6-methoxyphenol hydroxylase-like FAD-dependent oxidoreductase
VHVGFALDALEPLAEGVQMRFTNGETRIAQVVIGADGLRSRVRRLLFPGAALRYSGQTSWRGIARVRLPEALRDIGRETWSAGCRFGFSHISSDEIYWFAVQDAAANGRDEPGESLARLRRTFGRFPAPTAESLGSTAADEVIRTDLSDLRRLPAWSAGRVALLGDAAHATTPNLGQGGAQAIEDAWVLARCLEECAEHGPAFAKYEAMRRRKVDRVVTTSWWLGKLAHVGNPVGRRLRNVALRATPARVGERRLHELFEVGP